MMTNDSGRSPSGRATRELSQSSLSRPKASVPSAEKREGLCELCGREYRVWSAASPIWNAAIRGGCINGDERYNFLCADCFMGLAEDAGAASLFRVTAERTANLQTETPSGRVWSDASFVWEGQ